MEPEEPGQRAVDRSAADGERIALDESEVDRLLEADVDELRRDLAEIGSTALDVGVLANVLNAAGISIYPELLYAVAVTDPTAGPTTSSRGNLDTAHDYYEASLDTARDLDDSKLATLENLVEHCRDRGEDDRAAAWCRRAREALAAAPDPVAERHREWVERHCPP